MNNKVNAGSKLKETINEMKNFISAETIIGKPIKSDNVTIIPLVDVTFGLGFGLQGKKNDEAEGGGIGAQMSPNSLLVIEDGHAKLVNVKDSNSIVSLIPEVLDRLNLDILKKPGSSNKTVRFTKEED
ncbi:MAG: GerW family sporulation protein [Clostridia bacterium]|nr:GerW family sporulation protein [Clostridia bacterium]